MPNFKRPAPRSPAPKSGPTTHPQGPKSRPAPPVNGQIWLYGTHAVLAAWANPRRRCHRLLATPQASEQLPPLPQGRPSPEKADRQEIERHLPPGAVHQGLALLADPLQELAIEDICQEADKVTSAVVVVLDRPADPQNIGAVLRSAAAFGAQAVILPDRHSPDTTAALAKAASGALETVPLIRVTNLARALDQLKKAGFWCIGLDMEGQTLLGDADLGGKAALILGSEGEGLRRLTRETCDLLVRIPLSGRIESLNLAASAAIALYETRRRG